MIKGFVEIIKTDLSGKVTQIIDQPNLIVANFYRQVLGFYAANLDGKIFISSNTESPKFYIDDDSLPNMMFGTTPSNITSPIYIDSVTPHFAQYQTQFSPPTSTVTFQTVGLTNLYGKILAYLLLDTPCVQKTNEFLNIFYRLQFTNTSNSLANDAIDTFAKAITLGTPGFNFANVAHYFGSISPSLISNYKKPYAPIANLIDDVSSISQTSWGSGQNIDSHFKHKQLATFSENFQVGKIINQLLYGFNEAEKYAYLLGKTNVINPIQSFFTHSSGANKPFYDSLNVAANDQNIINLAGTWTGRFPELYKITITKSGAIGTAEYKFSIRKWLGFNGNSYEDTYAICPYLNTIAPAATNMHGWREENFDKLKFSNTQIVQYDLTGVTLLDVINGEYKTWDSSTAPQLNVTQIRQVAIDTVNKKIYCGCRSTGLWVIDVNNNSITHPITSPCYGVDVGRNNVVFVITSGGLVKSTSYNTTLPIAITPLSSCQFLKADPTHADDHVAIVISNNNTYQIKWWNGTTQITSDGISSGNIKPFPSSLEVSDIGSIWAINGSVLTFGFASTNNVQTIATYKFLNHSLYGTDYFYKIEFYKNYLISPTALTQVDGTIVTSYQQFGFSTTNSPYLLHLDNGIVLTQLGLRQLFTDNQYCWTNYGWNGSSWVEGNSNSKLLHSSVQPLLNGITVSFTDAPSLPTWFNSDYYTFAACDGLVKDNATTFYVDFSWYSAPALFNQPYTGTIPNSLEITLPCATDPAFITLEVDSPQVHTFKINGTLVTFVRTDGTSPAPNEVTIYASGKVKFNLADSGKTFTSLYTYVKV